ncbi:MAG: tRNA (adenosine(37)-N6)-dimethylallyltransferase MiaA [Bacteroidota bacterium]|nr:tRNA (adenosine(37)-N6)-dimethylallyltransferase MiaA [Bacteroidota bacterium]
MQTKKCIVITGPTASGKTDLAVEIALKHHTEILSADSRQCYKELDIGVARPSADQLSAVSHHFIGSHSIHEEVNSKTFEQYGLQELEAIFREKEVAVVVGGTGLYLKALFQGLDEVPVVDPAIREDLIAHYREKGLQWLQEEIRSNDPLFFSKGEIQNPQRVMRALEVVRSSGISILEFQTGKKLQRDFEVEQIFLDIPREELYQRINRRVDLMMDAGLLAEAEGLYSFRHLNALRTVGYQELFEYMEGRSSLEKAVESIKINTRHYAKRQITWFRKFRLD